MKSKFSGAANGRALEAHRAYLMCYAFGKINDPHTAEDLVQETLLAALADKSPFLGDSALRTWLTSILKHKIVDVYRRNGTDKRRHLAKDFHEQPELELAESEISQGLSDPAEVLARKQLERTLMTAVDSLPPRQRDAFVLVHMHGHSGGEAAARLGVSLGNLWIILHRTRKLLQSQLQGKYA